MSVRDNPSGSAAINPDSGQRTIIQIGAPTTRAPTIRATTIRAPTIRAPTIPATTIRVPTIPATTIRVPIIKITLTITLGRCV
jgi:hypothetical protein